MGFGIIENWFFYLIALIIVITIIRVKRRGYFWKDKAGNKISLKEFFKRWGKGIEGCSPVQQTLTSLWGYPFITGGIITGIVISTIHRTFWMVAILVGSCPITFMQIVSTYQKYVSQKKAEELVKEAMKKNGKH